MTSTMSERGRASGGGSRRALKAGLGAAGRLVGSLTRTTVHARPTEDEGRAPIEGCVEVTVAEGETVADVAARHGASTAGVLALNGLSWRTQVHAGQVLLVKPAERVARGPAADELHRHRVHEGESVSAIADRHGVATAAVLLANGLSRGSVVRPGQHLVIPVVNLRRTGSGAVRLTGDMRANAHLIVDAGRMIGVPDDALVVALAAAMQESSLHNLGADDTDAVGVFQQRPGDGWGHESMLKDPFRAALAFFGDPTPGVWATGLLDVEGWQFMGVGEAASIVQRGGAPSSAYAKWERSAREWLVELDRESGRR